MIFPEPKSEKYFDGRYELRSYDGETELMHLYKKYKCGSEEINIAHDELYGTDKYSIVINESGITITASCDCGIFRAMSSLRQLLKENGASLPYCEIEDEPDFVRRSYMLDISRCRMPKVAKLTRLIDLLADLKYNEFQLYMENFCFKYKHFPKYTEDIDCLTPEDIEYLVEYCEDRFIDLVPNQNSFGHMSTWLEQEEFKKLDVSGGSEITGTLNTLLPEAFEFVDKLYDSLLPHFKSEYVNIGLDEAYGLGRYALEEPCRIYGRENVFMDWLNKLAEHIRERYGKKVQFWSDMIRNYPSSFTRVPKDATALNWSYDLIDTSIMEKHCIDLHNKGVRYYVCPGTSTWIGFTGRFDVMSFNLRSCGEYGRDHGAYGYMLTDWGCGEGHTAFPVWSLVPCALGSQYSWNVGGLQNGANFKPHYIRAAQKYADEYIFHAPVANWLYKLQQYYLLEPERIHTSTMCAFIIRKPLSETDIPYFFDLKECGEDFYFENIIWYVNRALAGVEKVDFDETMKRQVILNSRMVILSAELNIIRLHQCAENDKIDELTAMIDDISKEYAYLWDMENYPVGKEHFLDQLADRRKELIAMRK